MDDRMKLRSRLKSFGKIVTESKQNTSTVDLPRINEEK